MDCCSPELIPLTDAQQGIWYASQTGRSSRLYATGQALYLRGSLEQTQLLRAIERALQEFEVLNHRFVDVQGVPSFGERTPKGSVILCDLSFQEQPETLAIRAMEQIIHQELGPDSLHQNEYRLYILSEHEVIWFSCIHHIAFDAYVYHLLYQRVAEHYNVLLRGGEATSCRFAALRTLYVEDQAYKNSPQYARDRDYWRYRCAQMPAPTFIGASVQETTVDIIQADARIDDEICLALDAFYQQSRIALSDLLIGVFASYFSSCLAGERQLLFGLPCMVRQDSLGAQAAVTRSNILPLLLTLPQDANFQDVCAVVAKNRRELHRHQRYRSEWISRDIGRVGNALPLYGIELNILPCFPSPDFTDLDASVRHIATGPVRDINVHLELGADLRPHTLRLLAHASRHNQSELQLHVRRLLHWMKQLIASPSAPLRMLPLAMPTELAQITRWNDTKHELPKHGILELFEQQVRTAPQQIAVMDESGVLTYGELELRSRRFACALDDYLQGAGGKVIGVALERSIELEVVLLAILRAGAVILPLSLDLPELRLRKMLNQAGACLTITSSVGQEGLPTGHPSLDLVTLTQIAELLNAETSPPKPAGQDAGVPAYILFTSGSSGEPKGVMVGHLALANRLQWMQAEYGLQPTDRVLQKTPATFDVSMWEFFWPLIGGATLVMARSGGHAEPEYIIDCIRYFDVTTVHFVPSMLALFLDEIERQPGPLKLRRVFASGEALSSELAQRYRRLLVAPLHNLYGPTEAAIDVTYHAVGLGVEGRGVPIGRPIWNTRIHILNAEGRCTPIGMAGELHIEGICLADGYVGQPSLTAERFVMRDDGVRLYRTGDLARWLPNGEIDYLGRMDQQIKIHGQRIELAEIETVISGHSQIHRACVTLFEGELIAYAVANDIRPTEDILVAHCREHLPGYMLPQRWVWLAELPLNSNGKLDRKALPEPVKRLRKDVSAPSNLTEQRLCEYFADALQLSSVTPEENFFELGGNSLSAVDAAARINTGLGWHITLANIFAHPSPKALAGYGQHDDVDMLDTMLLLRPVRHSVRGRLPTLFCIHPAGGIAWCYSGLARFLKTPCEIVGIQARGLTAGSRITPSMDEMAEEYAKRIRAHQPQGPYWLLGWSVGGMIAHSVAVHLEQQGQTVALLAMMDSYPSDLWRCFAAEVLNAREEETMALAALLFIAGIALPFDQGLPSLLVPKGQVLERSQTIGLLRKQGNALACLDDPTLDRLIDVVINSRRLVGSSNHDVYHGDMLFFTAAAPRVETWLDRAAWRPYVSGQIHNIDIDCDHPAMARAETLREIAGHLDCAFTALTGYLPAVPQSIDREDTVQEVER